MSKNKKMNDVTNHTLSKIQSLKVTTPTLLQDFVKNLTKYQQNYESLGQQGAVLADCIFKLGLSAGGDLGDGIRKISEYIKEQEAKREEMARVITLDILTPLKASIDAEQREAVAFEKNYKRDKDNQRQQIVKLEQQTKKSGKKVSPDVLKKQITELNDKIKEAELLDASKFREIVLLERRRFASVVELWCKFAVKETAANTESVAKYRSSEPEWNSLVASQSVIPKELEDMLTKQERTFVQIQSDNTGDYTANYDYYDSSYSSYDNYDQNAGYDQSAGYDQTGYDQNSYNQNYDYGSGETVIAHATALYDYASAEPTDLQLTAGETISVIQADDGSGWTKGQNAHGQVGIFPTTYIQYM